MIDSFLLRICANFSMYQQQKYLLEQRSFRSLKPLGFAHFLFEQCGPKHSVGASLAIHSIPTTLHWGTYAHLRSLSARRRSVFVRTSCRRDIKQHAASSVAVERSSTTVALSEEVRSKLCSSTRYKDKRQVDLTTAMHGPCSPAKSSARGS